MGRKKEGGRDYRRRPPVGEKLLSGWVLADKQLYGFFMSDADKVYSAAGEVEDYVVGVAAAAGGDGASHEVVDADGLLRGPLDGDLQVVGEYDIAATVFGVLDADRVVEMGYEEGVLSHDDGAWVVGVVVVPMGEGAAGMGEGLDDYGVVEGIEPVAGDAAEVVVVGEDAGIHLAMIDGAA